MKELVAYFVGAVVCSGVFVVLYSLLLERRVRFAVCRIYLLAITVLAALIPAVKIPVWPSEPAYVQTQASAGEMTTEIVGSTISNITPQAVCAAVWGLGTLLLLVIMMLQLVRMYRYHRDAVEVDFGEYKVLKVSDSISSFSFFRTIYIGADTLSEDLQVIIAHETGHIRHCHSAERVAMELFKALLWWNPFVWIAARRLTEVQEYEADSEVLRNGYDIELYINTLLKNLFGYSPDIANGLRSSLTKKRLKMMTLETGGRYVLLRMAAIVPVVAGLIMTFSFTAKAVQMIPEPMEQTTLKDVLVIVDGKEFDGDLNDIDTDTIEAMVILKGDSAIERYGERGANGVIVVDLKKINVEEAPDDGIKREDAPTFDASAGRISVSLAPQK